MKKDFNPYDKDASVQDLIMFANNAESAAGGARQRLTKMRNLALFEMTKELDALMKQTPNGELKDRLTKIYVIHRNICETI